MERLQELSLGDRLSQLKALRNKLAIAIDECISMRDLAALSRQYRETLKEIEEMEGKTENDDEIASILSDRLAVGKSKPVRKSSS